MAIKRIAMAAAASLFLFGQAAVAGALSTDQAVSLDRNASANPPITLIRGVPHAIHPHIYSRVAPAWGRLGCHRRRFLAGGGFFAGGGYSSFDGPYWIDYDLYYSDLPYGAACYWNCRHQGYGPQRCGTYCSNF